MRKQQSVIVCNNGTEAFQDRYDGEDFEILPGEETEMLVECATLCLGFGEEDKTRCLRRLGWAKTFNSIAEATKRLDTFSFHMPGEPRSSRNAQRTSSSAPASDETGEASQEVSPGVEPRKPGRPAKVQPGKKLSPLQKLAQAQVRAG